jgi:excisionase family DNA binding protein
MQHEGAAGQVQADRTGKTLERQEPKVVSITEAARINNVTRQAIYVAIKQKKLKARKESTRWTISLDDLIEYRSNKYSRAKSMYNGELVFDNSKGYYSVNQVAKMLGVPAQKIYYATRIGLLKASRKGAAWVIFADDVQEYKANYLDRMAPRAREENRVAEQQ